MTWLEILEKTGNTAHGREETLHTYLGMSENGQADLLAEDAIPFLAHIREKDPRLWLSDILPLVQFWPREERERFYKLLDDAQPKKEKSEKKLPSTTYSDVFNGEALVQRHGEVLRYCREWNAWYIWVGTHWQKDREEAVYDYARETLAYLFPFALENEDDKLFKHIVRSRSDRALSNMLHQASTMQIRTRPEEYDRSLWLLNCPNGTLNLKTGELHEHDPTMLITKCTATQYNAEASCPMWAEFLTTIMQAEPVTPDDTAADIERKEMFTTEMTGFLQRAVGYSLIGEVQEKILLIPWGTGDNGKSTFIETLATVIGSDYAMRTPTTLFLSKGEGSVPNDVAGLKGIRFAYAAEPTQDRRLDEALIKELTGGDTLSARFMRGEWFNFRPECTLWMATNHKPPTRGTDNALWNRIKLIPFNVSIPKEEQNLDLKNQLMTEAEGILAWAIKGCLEWQKNGLMEPDAVKVATSEYRKENDSIQTFIDEACQTDMYMSIQSSRLYEAFLKWGNSKISQKAFTSTLNLKGFESKRRKYGMAFLGIDLAPWDEQEAIENQGVGR